MRITTQTPEPTVRLTLEEQGNSNKVALIASWKHQDEIVYQVLMYFHGGANNITVEAVPLGTRITNPPFHIDGTRRVVIVR